VIVWLWDAGSGCGVTDDQARARRAAEVLMRGGRAGTGRVEKALAVTGISALTSGYLRTGHGWTARPRRDGLIRWVPLPAIAHRAAS
jgi:hypothetical protein